MKRHLVSGTCPEGAGATLVIRSQTCRDRITGENSCALLMPRMFAARQSPCQHSEFLN